MFGCRYSSRIWASTIMENPKFSAVVVVSTSFYIGNESLWSIPELDCLRSEVSEPSPLILEVFFSFASDHFWRKSTNSPGAIVFFFVVIIVVPIGTRSLRALLTERQGKGANSDSRSHHVFKTLPTHPRHQRFTPSTRRSI